MKALIAGGAGFIGTRLCKRFLKAGAEVVCVDNFRTSKKENIQDLLQRKDFHFIQQDILQPFPQNALSLVANCNLLINLASPASPRHYERYNLETAYANSLGAINLLEMAREYKMRFVYASTSEVYGNPQVHPQQEEYWGNVNPIGPRSCYDESKRFGEMISFLFLRRYQLDVRVARIFNTYGPGMQADDGRVISNFITQALSGADLTIYGDGKQTRSFCYIDDTVEGLFLLATEENLAGAVINLGASEEKSIIEIATLIIALSKSSSGLVFSALPENDPEKRCPDISRAKNLLSWTPQVTLADGLARTINFFRRREHFPNYRITTNYRRNILENISPIS